MENIIETKNVTKKYGNFTAVDNLSFSVKTGEVFAFLGPNGAGKTTTIKMLTTLLKPTQGEILLNGTNVTKNPHETRKSFGIVFQDPSLDNELTAYENMEFHAILYGLKKENQALNYKTPVLEYFSGLFSKFWLQIRYNFSTEPLAKPKNSIEFLSQNLDKIPRKSFVIQGYQERIKILLELVELWDRRDSYVKTFSGGMKRRLEIARGLLHKPKVLFLDEPTIGLDPQTRNHIWSYIHDLNKKENVTIFFTTHHMEEVERIAQKIAIIDHGKILITGTAEEIIKKAGAQNLEDAFITLTGSNIREEEVSAGLNRMRISNKMMR